MMSTKRILTMGLIMVVIISLKCWNSNKGENDCCNVIISHGIPIDLRLFVLVITTLEIPIEVRMIVGSVMLVMPSQAM